MYMLRSRCGLGVHLCSKEPVKKRQRGIRWGGLRMLDGGVLCPCLLILSPWVLRSTLPQI